MPTWGPLNSRILILSRCLVSVMNSAWAHLEDLRCLTSFACGPGVRLSDKAPELHRKLDQWEGHIKKGRTLFWHIPSRPRTDRRAWFAPFSVIVVPQAFESEAGEDPRRRYGCGRTSLCNALPEPAQSLEGCDGRWIWLCAAPGNSHVEVHDRVPCFAGENIVVGPNRRPSTRWGGPSFPRRDSIREPSTAVCWGCATEIASHAC
jgi:hypothetical protein